MGGAAIGAAVALAACGRPTLDEVVAEYREETGHDYASCGTAALDCLAAEAAPAPEAIACFLARLDACEAAELRTTQTTIEGDPIRSAYLVVPEEGGGCRIAYVVDTTEDEYGPRRIVRYECPSVARPASCPWVAPERCEAGVVEAE